MRHKRCQVVDLTSDDNRNIRNMARAPADGGSKAIRLTGHQNFRYRIMLALLAQRSVHISGIRSNSEDPGIKDFEVSFLRLIERITNGTLVEISYTGTEVYIRPGLVIGGKIVHECPTSRGVGWFLEPLLVLGIFGKQPLNITLRGITSSPRDVSVSVRFPIEDFWVSKTKLIEIVLQSSLCDVVIIQADTLRTAYLPLLSSFLPSTVTQPLELRIVKRGLLPGGGGEINYISPSIRAVKPGYNFVQPGSINKIRGIAHAVRVSPTFSQRLVNGAKEVLTPLCSDCRIYTDVYRGAESGKWVALYYCMRRRLDNILTQASHTLDHLVSV
jgi:RNA 3'-terminal phosphate cyclase-like protein